MVGLFAVAVAVGASPTRVIEPRRASGYEGPTAPVLVGVLADKGLAVEVTGPDGPGPALEDHPDDLLRLVLGLAATAPTEGRLRQDLYEADHVVRIEVGEGLLQLHHYPPAALVHPPPADAVPDATLRGFTPDETALVAFGLASLSPEERARVGATAHRRIHKYRSASNGGAAADVVGKAPHGRIAWYDGGTIWDARSFFPVIVGPPDAPRPATARVAVHEIGHLVGAARLIGALRGFHDASSADEKTRWKQCAEDFGSLGDSVYVPAGYGQVPGARLVTEYAMANDVEAFADGFALWKLDPTALAAEWPEVFAWFEAGRHLDREPCPAQ